MSYTPPVEQLDSDIPQTHAYHRPPAGSASRSPCPGLNTLANHGYIPRSGSDLSFFELFRAIAFVYNLSYPLALLLTTGGFATCGRLSWAPADRTTPSWPPARHAPWPTRIALLLVALAKTALRAVPTLTLDLNALSARGAAKIAHDAALVHADGGRTAPCAPSPPLVARLLACAGAQGLGLHELARYHAGRERDAPPLSGLHAQIAAAECSLVWQVLHYCPPSALAPVPREGEKKEAGDTLETAECVVSASRLEQWLGEERLPDGWWEPAGVRPAQTIGVLQTRSLANRIEKLGQAQSLTYNRAPSSSGDGAC
ncbi:hypothetical protein HYPSUDRAFT_642555 [Hypholoma sublateritium FD-334 SS-4]|uniref:Heme haloperoxidase family profile domain-containing protein n=1 Tax=Hypholoma sublateritium (strain FD-334 SS-4) TaxID=945553 RepID=A0A0D2L6L4_HYPSF|nr:hypothetical protein HYPSUDRAFT_642555 [Hypholoma sublateritium FD-334 SS-4]